MLNESTAPKLSTMSYRVVGQVGTGAGSTILQISDKASKGKRYALKVVKRLGPDDDVYLAQARVEYEAAQRLNHPAINKIHDIRLKRSLFKVCGVELLMDFVDGKTLDELEAPGRQQLLLIFSQVADAMSHMHRRGVYHGDLKPSNIMLGKDGQVKLIDFGTAWIKGEEKNRVQGTPQYMAPEQARDKVVDERTDIYNLGATMYRMFTGRYAQASPQVQDYARVLTPPKEVNPKIPGPLNNLIVSCLAMTREKRPEGMFEIKNQLDVVARHLGINVKAADLKGVADDPE